MICLDANDEVVTHVLRRSYFGLHRLDFTEAAVDPGGVEFNLPISDWLQLFAESGLFVERFLEVKAPASAHGEEFGSDAEWAKRFPSEQAWWLRKYRQPRTTMTELSSFNRARKVINCLLNDSARRCDIHTHMALTASTVV